MKGNASWAGGVGVYGGSRKRKEKKGQRYLKHRSANLREKKEEEEAKV
jgi:hypothetical protein